MIAKRALDHCSVSFTSGAESQARKMSTVTFYYTSATGNMEVKKQQQRIEMTLSGKKIPFEKVDVASSEENKKRMREIAGKPTALPPQLCNGDTYCGDFDAFDNAVEAEELEIFLKLK